MRHNQWFTWYEKAEARMGDEAVIRILRRGERVTDEGNVQISTLRTGIDFLLRCARIFTGVRRTISLVRSGRSGQYLVRRGRTGIGPIALSAGALISFVAGPHLPTFHGAALSVVALVEARSAKRRRRSIPV